MDVFDDCYFCREECKRAPAAIACLSLNLIAERDTNKAAKGLFISER